MVTMRKWGGESLGRTAPAETAHRYKMNWRSVLGEESGGERTRRQREVKESQRKVRGKWRREK